MKVFLSWSGQRSYAVAVALRKWLPLVLHYVKPWLSSRDIAAGERWTIELAEQLEASDFGIVCLTQDNVNAPWVLFEAGALSKKLLTGCVSPYLVDLDLSDLTGPLAQFQAKKTDKTSTLEMISDINSKAPEPVSQLVLDQLFEVLWSKFEEELARIPQAGHDVKPIRNQVEVLEELVALNRENERAIRRLEELVRSRETVLQASASGLSQVRGRSSRSRYQVLRVTVDHPEAGQDSDFVLAGSVVVMSGISNMTGLPPDEYEYTWLVFDSDGRVLSREELEKSVDHFVVLDITELHVARA